MNLSREQELGLQVAAGVGIVGIIVFHQQIANTATDLITRGARLTTTKLDGDVIPDDPEALAAQAAQVMGQDLAYGPYSGLDVYSLARMVRSEAGARENDIAKRVRIHAVINDYEGASWAPTAASLVLYSKNPASRGFYGKQSDGPRRVASTRDPYVGDVLLVRQVADERAQGIDLAEGASHFVDRNSMGKQEGSGSWDSLVERWGRDGLVPEQLNLPGLPSDFYVFKKA